MLTYDLSNIRTTQCARTWWRPDGSSGMDFPILIIQPLLKLRVLLWPSEKCFEIFLEYQNYFIQSKKYLCISLKNIFIVHQSLIFNSFNKKPILPRGETE